PLPENLGIRLEVDRGNVIERVQRDTPAAGLGLKPGDVVRQMGQVPIHSFGDAQYSLDRAPATGTLDVAWTRDGKAMTGKIDLPAGWRRTEFAWRPSMQRYVPSLPLYYCDDLTAAEKKKLGLSEKALAFRQSDRVQPRARNAGIQAGDIILGLDGEQLEMKQMEFLRHVEREHLVGDKITLRVLRNGETLKVPMTLGPR